MTEHADVLCFCARKVLDTGLGFASQRIFLRKTNDCTCWLSHHQVHTQERNTKRSVDIAGIMGLFAEVKTWWISHLLLFYIVLVSGLIANFLMLLTMIFVWPFNKELYRKIVVYLGYSWWSRKYFLITRRFSIT